MIAGMESSEDMHHLTVDNKKDKLLDLLDGTVEKAGVNEIIANESNPLILPFCGKRCFNKLNNYTDKPNLKEVSEYATASSWDSDGDDTSKSSISVLIDWMTTEENCSNYFGGLDSTGRTNGNCKEVYHLYIRDLIKEENGKTERFVFHNVFFSMMIILIIIYIHICVNQQDQYERQMQLKIKLIE